MLCDDTFIGWEVEFLGYALGWLRRFDEIKDRDALREMLYGARG